MPTRAHRLGQNEALFREVNERIVEVAGHFFEPGEEEGSKLSFVCECGYPSCAEQIGMTLAEYEHVRSQPVWFVVVPGHELAELERVVEQRPRYLVVEKTDPEAESAARETDPRSA
jgi:hypothetical protein